MPKDKNQNNNQVNQEDPRVYRKRVKNLIYQNWMEEEKKKIEVEVKGVQDRVDSDIQAKEVEIDQAAAKELLQIMDRIKKDWQDHLVELGLELKGIDKKLAEDMKAEFARLDKEYEKKEKEEQEKYEKKLQELEEEKKPVQDAVIQGQERISKEKEKCQEEFNKCWAEIAEIGAAIGEYSAKSNHATRDVQNKMQKKIEEQQLALATANQKSRTWDAAIKALEKEEKELSQRLEPFEKQQKKAENEYNQKLADLSKEKIDRMVAEKAKAAEKRKELENRYEEEKKLEYHPVRWISLSEEVENKKKYQKMQLSYNKTAEADQKRRELTVKMNATGKAFLDRLYSSVDFGYEVDRLENSEKSHGSSNTNEFNSMVEALKATEKAVGAGEVSAQVDENIRKSCLDAYKACQNYLQKKDRGWSLLEKMRSGTGKARIAMARGMMEKLKEFYPDLEAALEEERNRKEEAPAEQAEEKEPVKKSGKKPTRDISGELNAAKAQLRKQRGNEAGENTKQRTSQNINRKTKQNVL